MGLFELRRGVIVSCDITEIEELQHLVKSTCDVYGIVGYKVGFSLALSHGLKSAVNAIHEHTDLPVIYDHQKGGTDIPEVAPVFASICHEGGVDAAIIFPQAGPETERAFIDALRNETVVAMVGGHMTHPRYLAAEGGYIRDNAVEEMYLMGAKLGVGYFIVPGNRPESAKKYSQLLAREIREPAFCMPGIGRQGGDIRSAFDALGELPAYAIIGSSIYEAANAREAAQRFCQEAIA
jgi:orotidine-5'-phosphate decarboxylase